MRWLICGSDYDWSIERYFLKHLREQGVKVELFRAQNLFYGSYYRSGLSRILHRLKILNPLPEINKALISKVESFIPDVILVFKGMEVYPKTLEKFKNHGIKLVNYNPDNPFVFSGRGSGNKNVTESIHLFHLYLSYNSEVVQQLVRNKVYARCLPFGYDFDGLEPVDFDKIDEILAICFIGNPDQHRVNQLNFLVHNKIPVHVYGSNWKKYHLSSDVKVFAPLNRQNILTTIPSYRVQLNIMRKHNPTTHNMRSFEIPGAGGLMLAPDTPDHRKYFDINKNVFVYSDFQQCLFQCRRLLEITSKESTRIKKSAQIQSLNHTYKHRVDELLNLVNNL